MTKPVIEIITASTLGCAESVGECLLDCIEKNFNLPVTVFHGPHFSDVNPRAIWLIVTSTHGIGDFPDNIKPFFEYIQEQKEDLSYLCFGAIGIGNSDYDIFCGAVDKAVTILKERNAKQIGNTLKIDVNEHSIPEDIAESWVKVWIKDHVLNKK